MNRIMKITCVVWVVWGVTLLFGSNQTEAQYFSDVTENVGLTGVVGYRISIADVNNDGYPDLLLHKQADETTGDVLDRQFLYLNVQGNDPIDPYSREFIDYTEESGIRANRQGTDEGRHSSGAIFADVDNDGDLDMFSMVYVHTNYGLNKGTNDLLLNDGHGHFTLAPNSPFHNEPIYNTTSAVFMDYNNDGNIDLFIGNWYMNGVLTQDQLYQGHGDGSFTNVTDAAGINSALTCVYAVAATDWNHDGYVDLFAPSYSHLVKGSTPILWKNNSNGTFSQVQVTANYDQDRGYGSGKASFGTMPRDFDNDGDTDFLEIITHGLGDGASGIHSTVVVNENNVFSWDFYRVNGRSDDDPDMSHHGDHYGSWFDIDNDGLTDFVLTECGYGNNRLYLFKQSEDNTFHLVTSEAGLDSINALDLPVHNATPFDYDRDGDEDLLIGFASDDGVQLWRNDVGISNKSLTISLVGAGSPKQSNKSAIGARVEVTSGGNTYTREVYAGNGQMGPQAPLSVTFGLGQATTVDTIKVWWPNYNKTSVEFHDVAVNQFLEIYEEPLVSGMASLSDVTGNWYSINPAFLNWQDAKQAAEEAGGYLVSITSGEENKWISDTFGIHYNGDYYWLGGNDLAAEGTWVWAHGEPWGYTNWASGEPNDADDVEDALTWYHEGYSNADGYEWNDRDPSQLRTSLIEYDTNIYYNSVTGHWYTINPIRMSWQDAKQAAEEAGGYLASITSGEENRWISDTFGIHYNGDYYWFGGNDLVAEGTWEWAHGEPWGYTNWHSGEPNNASGVEDALTWYHESWSNADGYEWNDRDSLQLRASLVEFNYNPACSHPGISDSYIGGDDERDVIGGEMFDIDWMIADIRDNFMQVGIHTDYDPDLYGYDYGDLFISIDGWNPYGETPYYDDTHYNGEVWEYVFDVSEGYLYDIRDAQDHILLSGDLGYDFRPDQEVLIDPIGLTPVGQGGTLRGDEYYWMRFFIPDDIYLAYRQDNQNIAFHWTMTCANDVIEGAMPEPSTLILLGAGLIGIFTLRRKGLRR